MKVQYFRAALAIVVCAAFAACGSTAQYTPHADGGTLHPLGGQPPAIEGGGGGGGNGPPTPAPQPTPDSAGEDACNSGGGTFVDQVGGSGVSCAGQDGGPSAATVYDATCNYTISITKGHGSISRGGTLLGDFEMGITVYDSDCSYSMFS